MRSITKVGNGGYQLGRSHENPPTTSQEATTRWSRFPNKAEVTAYLLAEQFGLCAYSEVRPDLLSLGTHIEHIEPKSENPSRTFDYSNLVLNAISDADLKIIDRDEVFGGHAKRSKYDPQQFVSCLEPDCEQHFAYLSNGNVEPSRKLDQKRRSKAQDTIELLNLNSPILVTLRKNWLDELDDFIDQHIRNKQSLIDLAAIDLLPTAQKLSPFFTATRQRFGPLASQVLTDSI